MKNDVTLCHKDNCINATGKNAEIITFAAAFMLILMGVAALVRATNN
jgi:hypothetical protein